MAVIMATKKPTKAAPAAKKAPAKALPAKASPAKKPAPARPIPDYDDPLDDQLVDTSGTFRAVTAIAAAQIGHGEDSTRFPSDSLVMAAQRDGFVETGPSIADAAEEHVADDETVSAQKRERLKTLAALDEKRRKQRR